MGLLIPESGAGQAGSKPASPSREAHEGVKGVILSSSVLDLSHSGLHHLGAIFKVLNLGVSGAPLGHGTCVRHSRD